MAFESALFSGEIIYDDSTPDDHQDFSAGPRGRVGPSGYGAVAKPFPKEWLVDPSEWQARIQEMEETKSRVSDLIILNNIPSKNQDFLNFCWMFAPVHNVEVANVIAGNPYESLSPASAGGQITNWRNVGGFGNEALQKLSDWGAVPTKYWGDTDLNSRLLTPDNIARAAQNRVTEWMTTKPRSINEMVSMLFRRVPGSGGFNWWSHEVGLIDPVWRNGAIGLRIRNQWWINGKPWGDNNFAVLQGGKMAPDDAVWCNVTMAS